MPCAQDFKIKTTLCQESNLARETGLEEPLVIVVDGIGMAP